MSDIDTLRSITPDQMIEACEAANRWFRYGRKDKREMSADEVDIMRAGLRAAAATLRAYDADRVLIAQLVRALKDVIRDNSIKDECFCNAEQQFYCSWCAARAALSRADAAEKEGA